MDVSNFLTKMFSCATFMHKLDKLSILSHSQTFWKSNHTLFLILFFIILILHTTHIIIIFCRLFSQILNHHSPTIIIIIIILAHRDRSCGHTKRFSSRHCLVGPIIPPVRYTGADKTNSSVTLWPMVNDLLDASANRWTVARGFRHGIITIIVVETMPAHVNVSVPPTDQ